MKSKGKGSHYLKAQVQKKLPKVDVYWWLTDISILIKFLSPLGLMSRFRLLMSPNRFPFRSISCQFFLQCSLVQWLNVPRPIGRWGNEKHPFQSKAFPRLAVKLARVSIVIVDTIKDTMQWSRFIADATRRRDAWILANHEEGWKLSPNWWRHRLVSCTKEGLNA